MGNPITLVEQFANSLGSFSGVAPIRFSNGAWFEAAGINKSRNPTASAITDISRTKGIGAFDDTQITATVLSSDPDHPASDADGADCSQR